MEAAKELIALLNAQEEELGPNHVKVANTLAALADLLAHKGRLDEAEPLYWRAVEIRHKICGQSNLDVAAILEDLSILYETQGNASEAERLLRWSCDIRKKLCGPSGVEYQACLARLRRLSGDVEIGVATADGDFEPPSSVPQPREDFPWVDLFDLGVGLQEKEALLAAEALFKCLLAVATHFAPQSINHARALDHMARTYLFQARFQESRKHFEQALAIFENTVGFRDVDTVECLEGTADAHASLQEPEQARFLYSWALKVAQKEGFHDPADRIIGKVASLPFVSKKKGVDDALVEQILKETASEPARRKKTSAIYVKPSSPTPGPVPFGGLNALLEDLTPAPTKKSSVVLKPLIQPANEATAEVASTVPPSPVAEPRLQSAPAILQSHAVSAEAMQLQGADASTESMLKDRPGRKKSTASILRPVAPSFAPPHSPAVVPMEVPPVHPIGSHGSGGLDTLLRDIGTSSSSLAEASLSSRTTDVFPTTPDASSSGVTKKKTLGISKAPRKTGSVTKIAIEHVPKTDFDSFPGQLGVSPSGQLAGPWGDISPHDRHRTPPGAGLYPGLKTSLFRKTNTEDKDRKPVRPWQSPDRPPLEELLLGGADAKAPEPAYSRPSYALRAKPDPRAKAPEPDPSIFIPEQDEPADPAFVTYMWEKYFGQAERQLQVRNNREAERLLILALEKAESFGSADPRLWKTQCQLAILYEADKKYVRAGHLYRSLMQSAEKTLGYSHPDVVTYLERLGELYTIQDRWDEAEACYQHMLKIIQKTGSSMAVADVMGKLGLVQRRRLQR